MSDETKPDLPLTTEDETNADRDVVPKDTAGNVLEVVTNFISGLDTSTWLGRNASKAFGKLCSAPSKWYNAYFEGKAAETRTESEGRVKIRKEITDQIVQGIKVDPEYARRAEHKYAEKIIGEQLNLDKISAIAANELKNTEPDSSTNQGANAPNEEQSVDSTNQDASGNEERTINDVWINIFETEARPQSTEEGQILFGRILAGEIRNPGSYSIRTLKTLGELDQKVALLFKKLCSLSTGHMRSSGDVSTLRVLTLINEPLSAHTLEKYGMPYGDLSTLEEYGLTLDSDFTYWQFENFPILFRHQGQNWLVSPIASNREENQQLTLYGIELSRAARELYKLVDQKPMPKYTADMKKFLVGQNLSISEVDIISTEKNKGITWLKTKPKYDRS